MRQSSVLLAWPLMILAATSCSRREAAALVDAAPRVLYDDDEMRALVGRSSQLALGMTKADIFAILGPPTSDEINSSKESDPTTGAPRRIYGWSIHYVGRDGRTLSRVAPSEDRVMNGEPTIVLEVDRDGLLASISSNIRGVVQRGGTARNKKPLP